MSLTTINSDNVFKKGVIGNVRKAQEDSHDMAIMTPNGDVFVVCDGMGGHVGGAKASSIAVDSIIEYFKKEKYDNIPQALNEAIQYANMQIMGFANANPEFRGMGTTACIVILKDNEAYIAHVGDSRIYLYLGKEKQLHRITKDHSYVQTLVDAGQISDDEAEHHPNKNRILKALGIRPDMSPTVNVVHPKNGDTFLICTDGLNGMICDNTILQVMIQDIPLEKKGELLINLAMQGENGYPGGQDNCTVELIKIDNSPYENSTFISYNPKNQNEPKIGGKVQPSSGSGISGDSHKQPKNPLKIIMLIVLSLFVGILLLFIIGIVAPVKDADTQDEKLTDIITEMFETAKKCNFDDNVVETQRTELESKLELKKIKSDDIEDCLKQFDKMIRQGKKKMSLDKDNDNSQNTNEEENVSEMPVSEKKSQQGVNKNTDDKSKSNSEEKTEYVYHTVKKGDNLIKVAKQYDVTVEEIMNSNDLKSSKITIGEKLKIPTKNN